MKRLFIICAALALLLCACKNSAYFGYELNEKSRVYLPGSPADANIVDSFDLYQNPLQPMVAVGSKIYYFAAIDDPYNEQPPMLACYDAATGEAVNLCADENCAHYGYNYTTRCALCDLTDYSRLSVADGWLYYTRADRATTVTGTGEVGFNMPITGAATRDEVEVPHQLIGYNLTTGETKVLYEVEAENYLDNACLYDGKIYFCETRYAKRANLVYDRQDYDYIYFRDTTTDELIRRPLDLFYLKGAMKQEDVESVEIDQHGWYSREFLVNQRYNRRYKLIDDNLREKVYTLACYDIKSKAVTTLVDALDAEPEEIYVFDGSLFLLTADNCVRYSLKGTNRMVVVNYYDMCGYKVSVSSLQYDQYTQNLYFLAKPYSIKPTIYDGGSIYYIKLFEDGARFAPNRLAIGFDEVVTGYQLASEGIYFTAKRAYAEGADTRESPSAGIVYDVTPNSGSLYYIRWPDKTEIPVPFYTVYDAQVNGMPLEMPSVIGDRFYANAFAFNDFDYYFIYRLCEVTMEVTFSQQLAVENEDEAPPELIVKNTVCEIERPGAGIESGGLPAVRHYNRR